MENLENTEKKRGRPKKEANEAAENVSIPEQDVNKISVNKDVLESLLAKVEELEKKDQMNQEKLKMLYAVADKSRVFNYESKKSDKKPLQIKISVWNDSYIIGWRTIKDRLIMNPTTGRTAGEEQEYELLLLGKDGSMTKQVVNGYQTFSDCRYGERVDCTVIGKKEDMSGNFTYEVILPNEQIIQLDQRFLN